MRTWQKSNASLTRIFVYDEARHLLGEYDATGALVQETVWLEDIPVATLRPNGSGVEAFCIHTDHLNAPRRISRPSEQGGGVEPVFVLFRAPSQYFARPLAGILEAAGGQRADGPNTVACSVRCLKGRAAFGETGR